jgi:hypothetical protein
MHPLFAHPSGLSHDVIGADIEVHKDLVINFNELKLTDGVPRLILPGANFE